MFIPIQENQKKNYNEEDFYKYTPHRIFTPKQKEECWNMAAKIEGRNEKRWRMDIVGNPVLKALRGCNGPLCHEYDHILPHSKGGDTMLNNCQILQTRVNRVKGNKVGLTNTELSSYSIKTNLSDLEMDFVESMIYGNIAEPNSK